MKKTLRNILSYETEKVLNLNYKLHMYRLKMELGSVMKVCQECGRKNQLFKANARLWDIFCYERSVYLIICFK